MAQRTGVAVRLLSGRWLVGLILLPLFCFVPWILMTGPLDYGRKLGILSDVKLQSYVKPTDLEALANKDAAEAKPGQPPESVIKLDALLTREAANRLYSVAATALLVVIALGAGVCGLRTAWRLSADPADRWLWSVPLFIFGVVILAVRPGPGHRIYRLLGDNVFESTVGAIHERKSLDLLDDQQLVNNAVVVVAGVVLAFAGVLIAMRASRLRHTADQALYVELKRQLDTILLASGLMLAAGIIDLKQWTTLPLPFFSGDQVTAYSSFANAFVAFQSVCFVAALAAMFFPAALLLENARQRIARDEQRAEPGDAPAKIPIERFVMADLMRIAAMLAPVLVGPIASFANLKIAT